LLPFLFGLQGYIRSKEFSPEAWMIPGLGYDPCGNRKIICVSPNMYSLGSISIKSKRIADSVEALIGAYLNAAGEEAAFLFLVSLGMNIVFHSEMAVERSITTKCEELVNVRSLETLLGYAFSDPSLLMEALTHGSYQVAGSTACYQVNLKAFEAPLYLICIIFYFQYCFLY
jgi:endoribonuclease Dicer